MRLPRYLRNAFTSEKRFMARQRTIHSVLWNFLGTFTSRYTDYGGYWLFGLLIKEFDDELQVDLLAPCCDGANSPVNAAINAARTKFKEQYTKAGLVELQIKDAKLSIRILVESTNGVVNGRPCIGKSVCFNATAVMAGGRRYERERVLFVAAHNPVVESRRYVSSNLLPPPYRLP